MWSRCLAAIIAGCVLLVSFLPATASNATPVVYDADPANCTVEARTLKDLERILGLGTPSAPRERPETGDAIDPTSETGRAVTGTLEMLFACLNAGDRLRAYSLYTDAYLATILQPGDLPGVATALPNDPDELTRIVAIELHSLPNDAVLAKVTLDPALIPVEKLFEFILIPDGDQWKIDGVINEIDFSLP